MMDDLGDDVIRGLETKKFKIFFHF